MTASAEVKRSAPDPSRREMLNYAFGASIALMLAGSCGGLLWFTQQKIKFGDTSGFFQVDLTKLPELDGTPHALERRFWLVNTGDGLLALSAQCPRCGCLIKWSESNYRFECPCCGGKYQLDSTYIEGPSMRGMDKFPITVTTRNAQYTTYLTGAPVPFEGAISIAVNMNLKLFGRSRYRNSLGL